MESIKNMIFAHAEYTGSGRATEVLLQWESWLPKFVRVVPHDYQRVLEAQRQMKERGMTCDGAELAAFELNSRALLARAAGQ